MHFPSIENTSKTVLIASVSSVFVVFGRRFVLTDADQYVLNYLESNAGQIPHQTLLSIHQKLGVRTENNQAHDQNGKNQIINLTKRLLFFL